MKRLKKAEFYDMFKFRDEDFDCFMSPISTQEVRIIKSEDPNNGVRGVIDKNNIVYIWPAEVGHYEINEYTNVPVNNFRFAYCKSDNPPWLCDLTGLGGNLTLQETANIIDNNKSILQQIGDLNDAFVLMPMGEFTKGDNLNEWLTEYLEKQPVHSEKNIKRLIKKAEPVDGFYDDNDRSIWHTVYKNPTSKEVADIKKTGAIRGIVDSNGTLYIWYGGILHNSINKNLQETQINVEDSFRFNYEAGSWLIDGNNKFSIVQILEKILTYKDKLQIIGNVENALFEIFYTTDRGNAAIQFDQITPYLNGIKKLQRELV